MTAKRVRCVRERCRAHSLDELHRDSRSDPKSRHALWLQIPGLGPVEDPAQSTGWAATGTGDHQFTPSSRTRNFSPVFLTQTGNRVGGPIQPVIGAGEGVIETVTTSQKTDR
jgi:hypothetical protein